MEASILPSCSGVTDVGLASRAPDTFQSMINALQALDGTNKTVKLLTAESILTSVLNELDEDDLAADMLDQILETIAFLIERA